MKTFAQALAVGLGLSQLVSAACPSLQIFVGRGTTESQGGSGVMGNGQGLLGLVTSDIIAVVPGANSTGITYPATFDYTNSETQGVGNLTEMLIAFNGQCPTSKVALIGYSQGAQVVSDTVCGHSEVGFPPSAGIDLKYTQNVVAVVALADPANTPGLVGVTRFGNSTRGGGFPRTAIDSCAPYAGRFGNWCADNDDICDHGDSLLVHIQEVGFYRTEMADYIIQHYFEAIGEPVPPSATMSLTSVPYSSATVMPTVSANSTLTTPTAAAKVHRVSRADRRRGLRVP